MTEGEVAEVFRGPVKDTKQLRGFRGFGCAVDT